MSDTAKGSSKNALIAFWCRRLVAELKEMEAGTVKGKRSSGHTRPKPWSAGLHTPHGNITLRIVTAAAIDDPRVFKTEWVNRNRFCNYIRLSKASEVDNQLKGWLKAAYDLMG